MAKIFSNINFILKLIPLSIVIKICNKTGVSSPENINNIPAKFHSKFHKMDDKAKEILEINIIVVVIDFGKLMYHMNSIWKRLNC